MQFGKQTGLRYTPMSDRRSRLAQEMTHQPFNPMTPVEDLYQAGKEHMQGSLARFSMEDLRNIGQLPPIPIGQVSPEDYEAGGKELMATMFDTINPAAAIAKGVGAGLMTAYHGTPHKFLPTAKNPLGEFDLSKIGTGEGAQAYGHGIYLAENKEIAEHYANVLKDPDDLADMTLGGVDLYKGSQVVDYSPSRGAGPVDYARSALQEDALIQEWRLRQAYEEGGEEGVENVFKNIVRDKLDEVDEAYDPAEAAVVKQYYNDVLEDIKWGRNTNIDIKKGESHILDVDLPDEHIERMLDWDAPLNQQPKSVRIGLQKMVEDAGGDWKKVQSTKWTGGDFYRQWLGDYADETMSENLNALGIPGIRYFDGSSRSAGEGTRNFVVFDPSITKILSRK